METNNNIKDFNIAEALKYAPKGLKLYSPMFGEVKFEKIDEGNCVVVRDKYNNLHWFYEYGTYFPLDENNFSEGECLLFPSINHRCWNNWQNTLFLESIGSVCVETITGNKFILDHNGTCFSDYTGSDFIDIIENDSSNYLLNSRYATLEEAVSFIEELDNNGYEWDGEKVVKKGNIKPKFKVGDIIRNEPTGVFMTIKEVKDDSYITTDGTMLLFKYQDKWELASSKANPSLEDKVSILMDEISSLKQNIESLKVSRNQTRMRIDSLETWAIENGNPDIFKKVSVLADEIIDLRLRVKALEIQVIKDMSTPPLTQVYSCPDKAGDNVTLEEMKG